MLKAITWFCVWAAVVTGGVAVAYSQGSPTVTKRFTVEASLRIDGREITASQVWESTTYRLKPTMLPDQPGFRNRVRGEALIFPVSENKTVFLFRRDPMMPTTDSAGAWILNCVEAWRYEDYFAQLAAFRGECEVDLDPSIAIVTGTTDPQINLLVYGATDPGLEVLRIIVRTTDAAITTGIVAAYPWIESLPKLGNLASGSQVYRDDFTTEY